MPSTGQGLQHFYHGKLVEEARAKGGFRVVACSQGLTPERAEAYFQQAQTGSYTNIGVEQLVQGISLARCDEDAFLLTRMYPARYQDRGHPYPEYHGVILPGEHLRAVKGNITGLVVSLFAADQPDPPVFAAATTSLPPIPLSSLPPPATSEQEAEYVHFLYQLPGSGDGRSVEQLLSALLCGQSVAVVDAPAASREDDQRLWLAQALVYLLPPAARGSLTFATEVFNAATFRGTWLKFLYQHPLVKADESDLHFSWNEGLLAGEVLPHPYAAMIQARWSQGAEALVTLIHAEIEWRLVGNSASAAAADAAEGLRIASQSLELAQRFGKGKPDPAALVDALVEDQSLPAEHADAYWEGVYRLAGQGQGGALYQALQKWFPGERLRRPEWANRLREMMRQHVLTLAARSGKGAVGDFLALVYRDVRQQALDGVGRALSSALSDAEWRSLPGAETAALFPVINLRLVLKQHAEAFQLLALVQPEQAERMAGFAERVALHFDPGAVAFDEIAALASAEQSAALAEAAWAQIVYALARYYQWQSDAANRWLARLWIGEAIQLGEEDTLQLLGRIPDEDAQSGILRKAVDDVILTSSRTLRPLMLMRAAQALHADQMAEAPVILQQFFDSANILELAANVAATDTILSRLAEAMGQMRQSSKEAPPDWAGIEEEMRAQLAQLDDQGRQEFAGRCRRLAELLADSDVLSGRGGLPRIAQHPLRKNAGPPDSLAELFRWLAEIAAL